MDELPVFDEPGEEEEEGRPPSGEDVPDGFLYPDDFEDPGSSRPSSRTSSSGRASPSFFPESTDMDNIAWDELTVEKTYEYFAHATTLPGILRAFEVLKSKVGASEFEGLALFRALREKLCTQKTWKARDLFQLLEKRANQKEYMGQRGAEGVRVLIVGGGPVGLRLAIDCLLLGCNVQLIEKRLSFSRNNVLHLWPFTIEDLRQLGAKKFYGKFCAGAIDHICIRSLQCILLKICLLLGLSFHVGVEFCEVLEPNEDQGWHAKLNPSDHFLNQFEFDVLVGADGRRSTVPGFDRKELRGKLALAITANFTNYFTREEAAVDEISGVAFIFNQKFFKDLKAETGIDLENIVYYKDDTHYFVMTAKKDSLLKKGVLLADHHDTHDLLHPSNISKEDLYEYAVDAAGWSTELPQLDFALNHYDEPDVALFDFTSIFQAEYAARAVRRRGKDLILCVVGDALLEPFWPTGTGLARGFLSAQDTAWMIRGLGQGQRMLELLCEREVISQQLPQTTPDKLHSNIRTYTINPQTRYCNLQLRKLRVETVQHLYDTDSTMEISPALQRGSFKMKSSSTNKENRSPSPSLRPHPTSSLSPSPSRRPLTEGSINLAYYSEPANKMSLPNTSVLLKWAKSHIEGYGIHVDDLTTSWSNGLALCALIYRFHPELIPEFPELTPSDPILNNRRAFSVAEETFGISPLLKPEEMARPDKITLFTYLSLFHEFFADAEPASLAPPTKRPELAASVPQKVTPMKRKVAALYAPTPQSVERNWNTQTVKRRTSLSPPPMATKSLSNGDHDDDPSAAEPPKKKVYSQPREVKKSANPRPKSVAPATTATNASDVCYFCGKKVYLMERMSANGFFFHRSCFRCSHCNCQLKIGGYSLSKGERTGDKGKFFCTPHYRQLFLSNPEAINYSRAGQGPRERERERERSEVAVTEPRQAAEPVKPVSKLEKLVEQELEAEEAMEVTEERETDPAPQTPPIIITVESAEPSKEDIKGKEKKKSRKWTFKKKNKSEKPPEAKETPQEMEIESATGQKMEIDKERARESVKEEEKEKKLAAKPDEMAEEVMFTKRPRTPSNVQLLTANYERKEREKEDSLARSSRLVNRNKYRSRGGQKSIVRPMKVTPTSLENTDVMIQERRKQQRRFGEAQSIQREMSQLERQMEDMEEYSRQIEEELRNVEGTEREDHFMRTWLQLVNERNGLVRKTTELSLRVKELGLEDQQYEVDKELNELYTIPEDSQTENQKDKFEELFQRKLALVEERDELVIQIEEDRKREQEEDASTSNLMEDYRKSSIASRSSAGDYSPNSLKRVGSAPNVRYCRDSDDVAEEEQSLKEGAEHVEQVLLRDHKKRRSRIRTWFGSSK